MGDLPVAVEVLAIVAAGAALLWLHLRFWVARLTVPLPYAETHRVATADGLEHPGSIRRDGDGP